MMSFKKFIDFDNRNNNFYDNLYVSEENFVVKIPLASIEKKDSGKSDEKNGKEMKLERFDLSKYTYLTGYE
jgi:hypothetical protein